MSERESNDDSDDHRKRPATWEAYSDHYLDASSSAGDDRQVHAPQDALNQEEKRRAIANPSAAAQLPAAADPEQNSPNSVSKAMSREDHLAKVRNRARARRQRKKEYFEEMQRQVLSLSRNNAFLRKQNEELENAVKRARELALSREIQAAEQLTLKAKSFKSDQPLHSLGMAARAQNINVANMSARLDSTQLDASALHQLLRQRSAPPISSSLRQSLIEDLLRAELQKQEAQKETLRRASQASNLLSGNAAAVNRESQLLNLLAQQLIGGSRRPDTTIMPANIAEAARTLQQPRNPLNEYVNNLLNRKNSLSGSGAPGLTSAATMPSLRGQQNMLHPSLRGHELNVRNDSPISLDSLLRQQLASLSGQNVASSGSAFSSSASSIASAAFSPSAASASSAASIPSGNAASISSIAAAAGFPSGSSTGIPNAAAAAASLQNMNLPSDILSAIERAKSPGNSESVDDLRAQIISHLLKPPGPSSAPSPSPSGRNSRAA